MSRKSDGLLGNMLGDKWSLTHAPTAGTTVVASVSAPNSLKDRHILDCLSFSIKNMAAAAHTVTVAVRDTSAAGLVRMSLDMIVTNATSKEVVMNGLGIEGLHGEAIHITTDTVLASVKATVNASGWTDNSQDY